MTGLNKLPGAQLTTAEILSESTRVYGAYQALSLLVADLGLVAPEQGSPDELLAWVKSALTENGLAILRAPTNAEAADHMEKYPRNIVLQRNSYVTGGVWEIYRGGDRSVEVIRPDVEGEPVVLVWNGHSREWATMDTVGVTRAYRMDDHGEYVR